MNGIPKPLADEAAYLMLYDFALRGLDDSYRKQIDGLITLAYLRGQADGVNEVLNIIRGTIDRKLQ